MGKLDVLESLENITNEDVYDQYGNETWEDVDYGDNKIRKKQNK